MSDQTPGDTPAHHRPATNSSLTSLRRSPQRGDHSPATIHRLIDEIGQGTVGYAIDGRPRLTPTLFWRQDGLLYWHGSAASHTLRDLISGTPCCVNLFRLDGFVLARSAMHTSVNYRSVTLFGVAEEVLDPARKLAALATFYDRFLPGRWAEVRPPSPQELVATRVLRMPIEEASAKVRSGPPSDDAEDYDLPVWAGTVPVRVSLGVPVPDPALGHDLEPPDYLSRIPSP